MTTSPSTTTSKTWWSKDAIVSAIGLKPKKHHHHHHHPPPPSLSIKPPPIHDSPTTTHYANRPPSKSVSSTIDDSLGPSTPSDTAPRSRQSLFTLSDDPFAARVVADSTRLSAYSDKRPERSSYASSDYQRSHKLSLRSKSSFEVEIPPPMLASSSNVTLTDKPRIRPRGLTDCSPPTKPLSQDVPKLQPRLNPPTRLRSAPGPPNPPPSFSPPVPSPVIRQASLNRSLPPPSAAPPQLALPTVPPPPPPPVKEGEASPTQSESSISFASSEYNSDPYRPSPVRHRPYRTKEERIEAEKILSERKRGQKDQEVYDPSLLYSPPPKPPTRLPSSPLQVPQPRTLKKAASHQSITKGSISKSPYSPSPPVSPPPLQPEHRSPRKQRSFHHPKVSPLPGLPLPSFTTYSESAPSSPPASVRRRLFSGGSRRHFTPDDDDDVPSVFSLPPEHDISSSGPPIPIFPSSSSTFSPKSITSSLPPHEYLPQQIMSPAEMLKVEASVLETDFNEYARPRGLSITSTSTTGSWWDREREQARDEHVWQTNTNVTNHSRRNADGLGRSTSASVSVAMHRTHSTPPSLPSTRPSTSSGLPDMTSLPPPPRRRPGTSSGQLRKTPSMRSSDSLEASAPHPTATASVTTTSGVVVAAAATAPPPAWKKRQSLMRKPSFLDIEDDEVRPPMPKFDARVSTAFGNPHEDDMSMSFLNLRDSFDTVRGSDE